MNLHHVSSNMRRNATQWLGIGYSIVAVSLFVISIFRNPRLPYLGDYTEWIYQGVLLKDVITGHPDAGYTFKHYPVPNSLTTVGVALFLLLFSWKIAAKIWICLQLLTGLFCAFQMYIASERKSAVCWFILPSAVFCGINFWCGFINFQFGIYFAMLFCALLLRGSESRWKYAAMLALLFLTHMVPFAFAILLLMLYVWRKKDWNMLWQTIPSAFLCLWYAWARFFVEKNADGQANMVSSIKYMSPAFPLFKINSYLKSWGFVNPALSLQDSLSLSIFGKRVFIALLVISVLVATIIFSRFLVEAKRAAAKNGEPWFLWTGVLVFFIAFCFMPGEALGISDPGARMLQVAIWVSIMALPSMRQWQAWTVSVGSGILLGANLFLINHVALQSPRVGATTTSLPTGIGSFAHAFYADRADYSANLETHRMTRDIYPTAMFLEKTCLANRHWK